MKTRAHVSAPLTANPVRENTGIGQSTQFLPATNNAILNSRAAASTLQCYQQMANKSFATRQLKQRAEVVAAGPATGELHYYQQMANNSPRTMQFHQRPVIAPGNMPGSGQRMDDAGSAGEGDLLGSQVFTVKQLAIDARDTPVIQRAMTKLAFTNWDNKRRVDLQASAVTYAGTDDGKADAAREIRSSRDALQLINNNLDIAIDTYNQSISMANLSAVLELAAAFDVAIYEDQDAYAGSVAFNQLDRLYMGLLGELAAQIEAVLANVNSEADTLTGIARIGAGNAPELNKDEALKKKVSERRLNSTKKADLALAVPNADTASKSELREGLTIDSALAAGTFSSLKKFAHAGVDVDFETNNPVNGYKHWDQKAMYLEGPAWDGRVEHTHAKEVNNDGKKTGILVDATYATDKDYERGWLSLNRSILAGRIDPRAIKETKLANASAAEKNITFDSTKSYGEADVELYNLKILHKAIKDAGFTSQSISADLNGLAGQITTKLAAKEFVSYRDHRGRLSRGNYIEINGVHFDARQIGAKVRVVINTNDMVCYLTVTHYEPFTWKPGAGAQVNKSAFFVMTGLGTLNLPTTST